MKVDKNLTYIVVIKTDDMSYIAGWIMTQWLKQQCVELGVLSYNSFNGDISEINIEDKNFRFMCMDTAPVVLLDACADRVTLFTTEEYENLPKKISTRKWFKNDKGSLPELVWTSLYGNLNDFPEWIRMHSQSCADRSNITADHKKLMYYLHYNNTDDHTDIRYIFDLFTKISEMSISDILATVETKYPQAHESWRAAFLLGGMLPFLKYKWAMPPLLNAINSTSAKDIQIIDLNYEPVTLEYQTKGEK